MCIRDRLDSERENGWYQLTETGWRQYADDFGDQEHVRSVILPNGEPAEFHQPLRFETRTRTHEFPLPPGDHSVGCSQDTNTGDLIVTLKSDESGASLRYARITVDDFGD